MVLKRSENSKYNHIRDDLPRIRHGVSAGGRSRLPYLGADATPPENTEKSHRNPANLNQIWIAITLFRLIQPKQSSVWY